MKITDPDIIKNGEKDLIEAVKDDLDLDAVKEILKKRMEAAKLSSKGGEIIVHNNEIAYRLDFDIRLSGSLMFDRQGNYISESDQTVDDEPGEQEAPGKSDDQENLISEDFDLEDINIDETLEEVAPQTLLNDDEDTEIENIETPEEEELNIALPDYNLDDELDPENGNPDENENEPDVEVGAQKDDLIENDIGEDDDMSDILQESRDFWDQKKDS
ncbi:MAG: hypothetical protein DRH93_07945 [Deltaproteobacteria bacterium]|nr:MAG: hypothetical protein DRH93_07945 [Deltaproteobacteria bacterium]